MSNNAENVKNVKNLTKKHKIFYTSYIIRSSMAKCALPRL